MQKTAYEMRISDWSSDVCSSDLVDDALTHVHQIELGDAELGAVAVQCVELRARDRILDAGGAVDGRHIVIRHRQIRGQAPRLAAIETQIGRASCRESVCQYV